MSRRFLLFVGSVALGAVVVMAALSGSGLQASSADAGSYDVRATAIEACSCPLFCSCYYNPEPAGGHMCKFNLAYQFEDGSHWGGTDLSGAKVWLSGDLGDHFGDGTTEWAVVTFDNATTPEQREAINGWIGRVFQVEWGKVDVRTDDISWENGDEVAHAEMASGMAKVRLDMVKNPAGDQATVMNTPYWWADSNEGFLLGHSTHHFHGEGEERTYDFEKRNGFVITSRVSGEIEAPEGE
ncbi:MAG: DUF1326 domain-containing protein [Thermoanaerobaculia bacterium]|nr:DUF1326 domain-containing protein [Thermoanaerobaculia bacterium]